MPHFTLNPNDDGTVSTILKDGVPHAEGVKLEPAWAIVRTYFEVAAGNIDQMKCATDPKLRRSLGLQAFLMSLTGIEAFTNVFFLLLGRGRSDDDIIKAVKKQAPLIKRLASLIEISFDQPLADQDLILKRVRELYQLRNQIVHPRWEPASMLVAGEVPIIIHDLSQNFQIAFEDVTLCREAYLWCLLLVSRVGKNAGNTDSGFCFFWAGEYGLSEDVLLKELGL